MVLVEFTEGFSRGSARVIGGGWGKKNHSTYACKVRHITGGDVTDKI